MYRITINFKFSDAYKERLQVFRFFIIDRNLERKFKVHYEIMIVLKSYSKDTNNFLSRLKKFVKKLRRHPVQSRMYLLVRGADSKKC